MFSVCSFGRTLVAVSLLPPRGRDGGPGSVRPLSWRCNAGLGKWAHRHAHRFASRCATAGARRMIKAFAVTAKNRLAVALDRGAFCVAPQLYVDAESRRQSNLPLS